MLISAATAAALGGEFHLDGPHQIQTKELRLVEALFVTRS